MARRVLIVGASLAGLRAAEALRQSGFGGEIVVVGAEPHLPYNRPPLSKAALLEGGDVAEIFAGLAFPLKPAIADIVWRLGQAVRCVDLAAREAELADGSRFSFDGLIAASGLRPRRVPLAGAEQDRLVLRGLEDAVALRNRLRPGQRLVVIGGGFIGCEVAATARKLGCTVTVIEPLDLPMQRAIGREPAAALLALHEAAGVSFRLGQSVVAFEASGSGGLKAAHLRDGSAVGADVAIEAVGSVPNVEWLEGNSLDLSDGLLCDGYMAVAGAADCFAAGDVARFPNSLIDAVPRRIEHWSVPALTARRAAQSLLAEANGASRGDADFAFLPTFWSDQCGLRIQSAGMPSLADRREVIAGSLTPRGIREEGAAIGYWRGSQPIGLVGIGLPPAPFLQLQVALQKSMKNNSDAAFLQHSVFPDTRGGVGGDEEMQLITSN